MPEKILTIRILEDNKEALLLILRIIEEQIAGGNKEGHALGCPWTYKEQPFETPRLAYIKQMTSWSVDCPYCNHNQGYISSPYNIKFKENPTRCEKCKKQFVVIE